MDDLFRILDYIETKADLYLPADVDARYRSAMNFERVDRPPLVVKCEEHPLGLKPFPYRQAFDDPAKMMFNQLLTRVVPGLEFQDDSPLAVRTDHGTIIVASLLGAKWSIIEDEYPWVMPVGNIDELRRLTDCSPDFSKDGLGPRVIEYLDFYRDTLEGYPNCQEAIQIALPDLQGPFDTAHQICGSAIYYYLYDHREVISDLLSVVTRTMVSYARKVKPLTIDRLRPDFICQHGYVVPGEIMVRDDSIINVSATTYEEMIRPFDELVLTELGGGTIHFCGNGQHQIDSLLELKSLKGLDFGQPDLMDMDGIYEKCSGQRIPLTNIGVSPQDIFSGSAAKRFPTGVVFTCEVKTIAEGRQVMDSYRSNNIS